MSLFFILDTFWTNCIHYHPTSSSVTFQPRAKLQFHIPFHLTVIKYLWGIYVCKIIWLFQCYSNLNMSKFEFFLQHPHTARSGYPERKWGWLSSNWEASQVRITLVKFSVWDLTLCPAGEETQGCRYPRIGWIHTEFQILHSPCPRAPQA